MCGHVSPCAHTRMHGLHLFLCPPPGLASHITPDSEDTPQTEPDSGCRHPGTKTATRPPLPPPILSRTAGAVPTSDPGTGCRYRSLVRPALPPGPARSTRPANRALPVPTLPQPRPSDHAGAARESYSRSGTPEAPTRPKPARPAAKVGYGLPPKARRNHRSTNCRLQIKAKATSGIRHVDFAGQPFSNVATHQTIRRSAVTKRVTRAIIR